MWQLLFSGGAPSQCNIEEKLRCTNFWQSTMGLGEQIPTLWRRCSSKDEFKIPMIERLTVCGSYVGNPLKGVLYVWWSALLERVRAFLVRRASSESGFFQCF